MTIASLAVALVTLAIGLIVCLVIILEKMREVQLLEATLSSLKVTISTLRGEVARAHVAAAGAGVAGKPMEELVEAVNDGLDGLGQREDAE